jgi:antitoxin MazE
VIKNLSVIGNSLGLIIDRPILELLGISRDTPLEITTDGIGLLIRPVQKPQAESVRLAAERAMDRHAEAFEKLAK